MTIITLWGWGFGANHLSHQEKKQNLENNNSFLDPKIGEFGAQKMGFLGGNFYQKSYF